jgi:hypothetical protein
MRTYKTQNQDGNYIKFKGIEYYYLIDDMGVGIRRKDNRVPMPEDVEALTQYLFEEGFAEEEDYE